MWGARAVKVVISEFRTWRKQVGLLTDVGEEDGEDGGKNQTQGNPNLSHSCL